MARKAKPLRLLTRSLRSKHVGNEAGARGATSAVRTDTLEAFRSVGGEGTQGKIPASMLGPRALGAEATPTSRDSAQVPLLTCLPAATRISTGFTGTTAQQAEPERTRVMPDPYGTVAPDSQQRRAPYPPPCRDRSPDPTASSRAPTVRPAARTWWDGRRAKGAAARQTRKAATSGSEVLPGAVDLAAVVHAVAGRRTGVRVDPDSSSRRSTIWSAAR